MTYLEITLQVEPGNRAARDVVGGLSPLLAATPEVRVHEAR